MDNDNAKVNMLQAIDSQTNERIATLEQDALAEATRLEQELRTKIDTEVKQSEKEIKEIEERLLFDAQSHLKSEIKRINLENRQQIMSEILEETYTQLVALTQQPEYDVRLLNWIKEAVAVVASDAIYVRLGKSDLSYWQEKTMQAVTLYAKDALGLDLKIALHPDGVHAGIGPIVTSQDGRRMCDNTLASRFAKEKVNLSRMATAALY